MTNETNNKEITPDPFFKDFPIQETRELLENMTAEERILWAIKEFDSKFVFTTSFGIQSAVLLNMVDSLGLQKPPAFIWVDTGYLPTETYIYADQLTKQLNINLYVVQSIISPARMEALHGKLWETNSVQDLEKYHLIRKVTPLEQAFKELDVSCWASGVRSGQTSHRRSMSSLDVIRNRLSLRPLLNWSKKDIFYYMKEHNLPQHPLFEKGYSTVGDWHSSGPETMKEGGRNTRFQGLKEECGIHLPDSNNN